MLWLCLPAILISSPVRLYLCGYPGHRSDESYADARAFRNAAIPKPKAVEPPIRVQQHAYPAHNEQSP